MSYDYDLLTIGAGSGGVRASRVAADHGARAAVVEAARIGGTCVNAGCVPKKLLVYASQHRDALADAAGFGWTVGPATFDWATLIANKDREIRRLNEAYARALTAAGVTIVEGRARLAGPHEVVVETGAAGTERRVTAQHVLIATGAVPARPAFPGAEVCLVSDDVFRLPAMPKRIVVVGGGYIGVELAGVFHGLGAEVTLVHRGAHILRGFDDDARGFLADSMRKKGVALLMNARVEQVRRDGDAFVCLLDRERVISADAVLLAVGRRPNTEALGLEAAGVATDEQGAIRVDAFSRTSAESVFAVGDVTNRMNLTPIALAEGAAVASTLFGGRPTTVDYADVPTAVFGQPPLACVGLTEARARDLHGALDVYTTDFRPLKHTMTGSSERTFMKLVVARATGRVLGAHMVGADAPEIVQAVAIALRCGATKAAFDTTIGIHPTAAEELVTMRTPRADDD